MTAPRSTETDDAEIRIGVSACLLGKKVRLDANHKRDRYITDVLSRFVTFVSVCPEIEVGMGLPREAVRLMGDAASPRMVGRESGEDWTDRMNRFAVRRVRQTNMQDLSGFIFKNRSPSCGMERVKLYVSPDRMERKGVGLFAVAVMKQHPDLPVEEEGRLTDAALRENFIERVFAYHRLQQLYARPFSRRSMIAFHTTHKLMLLAHSPERYRQLGRLVARMKGIKPSRFREEYRSQFMRALQYKATVRKNTNVLQHIAGYLKNHLSTSEKADVHAAIEDYHRSLVPLIVPITLLRHFIGKYDVEYIRDQYYLNPHPKELMLRNHV